MIKRTIVKLCLLTILFAVGACGNDVEVAKTFYDQNGKVFLENGKMHNATTDFTEEELKHRLISSGWLRNYAFYYDKQKVGKRNEISFFESNYYVFTGDGYAYMGNVTNSSNKEEYSYTTSGRNVSMTSTRGGSFTMRVVAIDDTLMVTDSPMTGKNILNYDDATVVQRTVFIKYRPNY